MQTRQARRAIVRGVPDSYDRCIQYGKDQEVVDVALAKRQHGRYCDALRAAGVELVVLPPDPEFPDCCYVEDPAIVVDRTAVILRSGARSRAGEAAALRPVLKRFLEVTDLPCGGTVDGGDVLVVDDTVFVGVSKRTDEAGVEGLRRLLGPLGWRVLPVPIRNILHLKSVCSYIGDRCLLYAPGHFDPAPFAAYDLIEVDPGDAYSTNCLAVNGRVLVSAGFPRTRQAIDKMGLEVLELDMSEFRKGGGSLTCLSLLMRF